MQLHQLHRPKDSPIHIIIIIFFFNKSLLLTKPAFIWFKVQQKQ